MLAFLDFEASSLAKASFPIEVGWVFEDGRAEFHLIRPLPEWTDWDERAAKIHGISQATLLAEGEAAETVARRLLTELGTLPVFASSPSWDGKWLSVLLRAGGLPRHAMRLRDTEEAQMAAARAAFADVLPPEAVEERARGVIERVRATAAAWPVEHRALADAKRERRLWLEITVEAEREAAAGRS